MKIGRVSYKNKLYNYWNKFLFLNHLLVDIIHWINEWIIWNVIFNQPNIQKLPFLTHILKTCMIFKSVQNGNRTFNTCTYHLVIVKNESNCKITTILVVDEYLQEILFFIKILLLKVNITCFLVTEYCRD